MNNIRQIITERLENAKNDFLNAIKNGNATDREIGELQYTVLTYQDCLNLIPAPRTEADILNDFEKLGWKVTQNDDSCMILCFNGFTRIVILKCNKQYSINNLCNMQEHKLLNELIEVWGWL